ncbi:hypothetical protein HHI36_000490 [Cryptolaemus montrouzieri]|uniref:Uncharacterized protein n=1 Tax=Cryptolaemus montrouzieri TaxID=559131 RepID=A0ABD2P4T9_9CUCU
MAMQNLSLYEADHICKTKRNPPVPSEFKLQKEKAGVIQEIHPVSPRKSYANAVINSMKLTETNHKVSQNSCYVNKNKRKDNNPGYDQIEHEKLVWKYTPSYPKRLYSITSQSLSSYPVNIETIAEIHQYLNASSSSKQLDQVASEKTIRKLTKYTESYLRKGENMDISLVSLSPYSNYI